MAQDPDPPDPDRTLREPWAAHARHWNRLGPPLRPSPEDLLRLRTAWVDSLPQGIPDGRVEILSLGVTPEIARFSWAPMAALTAIDANELMIRAVWPGDTPGRKAVLGDWLQMPFASSSFDLIVCDCGLAPLASSDRLTELSRKLRRVLRSTGRVVMRHLTCPSRPEPFEAIVSAVESGRLRNFHELKLRLLFALAAGRPDAGVRLAAAWDRFNDLFPGRGALAARLGCAPEIVETIDAYRGRDAWYLFPSLSEVARAFDGFRLRAGPAASYPLGDCCPVFSLTPVP